MDPKLENFKINGSVDAIIEYMDRFNFWIDTRETSEEKAIKGAFLMTIENVAVTLIKTLMQVPHQLCLFQRS